MTNLLNNENISDEDQLRLVMLYALRYEKDSPVQLMQLFNKLASRSATYKPGVNLNCCLSEYLNFLLCSFVLRESFQMMVRIFLVSSPSHIFCFGF